MRSHDRIKFNNDNEEIEYERQQKSMRHTALDHPMQQASAIETLVDGSAITKHRMLAHQFSREMPSI